jgi:hypothetical protein
VNVKLLSVFRCHRLIIALSNAVEMRNRVSERRREILVHLQTLLFRLAGRHNVDEVASDVEITELIDTVRQPDGMGIIKLASCVLFICHIHL